MVRQLSRLMLFSCSSCIVPSFSFPTFRTQSRPVSNFHRTLRTISIVTSSSCSSTSSSELGGIASPQFDYSTEEGWNAFYSSNKEEEEEETKFFEYEWHSSIPNSSIISSIPPNNNNNKAAASETNNILMVGCGNSALPRDLKNHFHDKKSITGLDYSLPCIQMLSCQYQHESDMYFVQGDATQIGNTKKLTLPQQTYQTVIDKGLMDALMCGDGWETSLARYINGVKEILDDKENGGIFILVSYKLATSTKEFLLDLIEEEKGGWVWVLDEEQRSNGRVSFSYLTRK